MFGLLSSDWGLGGHGLVRTVKDLAVETSCIQMAKHVNVWVPEIGISCFVWWSRDAPGLLLQNNELTCTAFGSSWCGDPMG